MSYPESEPYDTGYLDVGDGHEIYYEQSGNPDGIPVIQHHGGPGGGFSPVFRTLYNPDHYRLVVYDQRGAGRSKPFASVQANTIPHLVGDIERLRAHLDIHRCLMVGGSWGSALSLLYAIEHSQHVQALIVSGISLAEPFGANWFVEAGGASRLMPDWFDPYLQFIPPEDRTMGLGKAYYDVLQGPDDDARVIEAAKRFDIWDRALLRHSVEQNMIMEVIDNPAESLALARIFFHFLMHEYKDGNKWRILDGVKRLSHVPCAIMHGRYDLICPAENAWLLHKAYPNSTLEIVQDAGHSIIDRAQIARIVGITDRWAGDGTLKI